MTGAGWRTNGDNGGNCVEVGALARAVAVRDSQDRGGAQLAFAPGTWTAFTEQLKAVA